MASAVFAKGSHGRYDVWIGPTYHERQVTLDILHGPLMLALGFVPGYGWYVAILMLPRKVYQMIEARGGRPTRIVA